MDSQVPSRRVTIEHCTLPCARPFDDVHQALLHSIPALRPEVSEILARGEKEKVAIARRDWPRLWLFLTRNHGELTAADGLSSKAIQYEIGNPLTAERMTRHVLAAGLYAPLRVILYENSSGHVFFEYDLPSSLFGQFGNDDVTAVARELDAELEIVLRAAGGPSEELNASGRLRACGSSQRTRPKGMECAK